MSNALFDSSLSVPVSLSAIRTSVDGAVTVASRSQAVLDMQATLTMTSALMQGTAAMRRYRETFLPMWPAEDPVDYAKRLAKSTLFPAYKRTATTLAAKPFSKQITWGDDTPAKYEPWLDNIDLQGNNADVVISQVFKNAMADGFCGILVEHTIRPNGVISQRDEKIAGLRPYFVQVRQSQILGWRTETNNAVVRLAQLRIMESIEVPYGEFGTKYIDQVRVLEPGRWRTYRAPQDEQGWLLYDEGVTNLTEIPFVAFYGERLGFMLSRPPLLELAHLNVKHWQQQSDQDNLMRVARVPILTVRGTDDKFRLVVGASSAVNLGESPHAEMRFVEHSGAAIGAGKTQLDDLREEMRQAGAELLVLRPGPATATEVASDNAVGMCALQEMTQNAEDALDQALQFMAEYTGEVQGGHAELFKDFGAATLSDASAQLLFVMSNAGKLSDQTLVAEYKRRGILCAEVDYDTEKERIETQGPPPGSELGPIDPKTGLPKPPASPGPPGSNKPPFTGKPAFGKKP